MYLEFDNEQIYIATGGRAFDPAQASILFIHGAAMDHTVWVLYTRYFARHGFNALGVDLPGHGRSGGNALGSIEALAVWLIRLMDELAVDGAALVGHSMGSLAALETAAREPARIERLVLLGTGVPMPVGEALLEAARGNTRAAIDMVTLWAHAYASQLGGNPVAGVNLMNADMRVIEQARDLVLYTDLKACNDYQGGLESAARVRCPVAIVVGERDQMTPPHSVQALAQTLARATLSRIPDCGHIMMSEQPEAVHQALVAALA